VPGLRRSEVAAVAGLSVEYYARLERGQIAGASTGVLDALARALQLDETETAHLFDLARAADGIPTSGRSRRRTASKAVSRPSLHWALEAIKDGVAFVRDPHQNLLATNSLGQAFYSPVIGDGGRLPNLARFQFLDPASRDFYPDWDLFAEMCVGIMRTDAGRDPHDRGLQDLVGELSTRSETFRRLWADHNVRSHGTGTKRFRHPVVGELTLAYEELAITAEPGLALFIYTAEPAPPRRATRAARLLGGVGAGVHPHRPLLERRPTPTMKLTPSSIDSATGPADWFTGEVYIDGIRNPDEQSAVGCAHVRFTPGARTAWHHHPKGQTLYVTDGIGYVARRGGEPQEIRPGDVVYIEPGEEHWHGATPAASWPTSPSRRRTARARS
jgi:quercetin dioxygenase-like cupin family protein/transcriptional regulator with XRE-family HTH domain